MKEEEEEIVKQSGSVCFFELFNRSCGDHSNRAFIHFEVAIKKITFDSTFLL